MNYSPYTTSDQLRLECAHNNIPLNFIGFKDELNYRQPYNGAYIVNMQNSTDRAGRQNSGTHWTCFILTDSRCYYFDSFQALAPRAVERFFKRREYGYYTSNNMDIQNINAGGCGEYCVAFLNFMYNSRPAMRYNVFLGKWSRRPGSNLRILKKMLL